MHHVSCIIVQCPACLARQTLELPPADTTLRKFAAILAMTSRAAIWSAKMCDLKSAKKNIEMIRYQHIYFQTGKSEKKFSGGFLQQLPNPPWIFFVSLNFLRSRIFWRIPSPTEDRIVPPSEIRVSTEAGGCRFQRWVWSFRGLQKSPSFPVEIRTHFVVVFIFL